MQCVEKVRSFFCQKMDNNIEIGVKFPTTFERQIKKVLFHTKLTDTTAHQSMSLNIDSTVSQRKQVPKYHCFHAIDVDLLKNNQTIIL